MRGRWHRFPPKSGNFSLLKPSYDKSVHDKGELQFEKLVETYYGPLFRFAYSLAHEESSACDLVQETFAVWAQKGHQLQDASKVKTWLFTTLHRRFLQDKRRETRFVHVELGSAEMELPKLEPQMVNSMDSHSVVKMLSQVNEAFQAPVALFYLEDYSYNEIAELLGLPLGTVKSRIARGLSELRALMIDAPRKGAGEVRP
jgi:RNA polymerase sigma-70 factor (ECF subfamily)